MDATMKHIIAVTVILLFSAPALAQVETPTLSPTPEQNPEQAHAESGNNLAPRSVTTQTFRRDGVFISKQGSPECDAPDCLFFAPSLSQVKTPSLSQAPERNPGHVPAESGNKLTPRPVATKRVIPDGVH
jgi:hypothetical protein